MRVVLDELLEGKRAGGEFAGRGGISAVARRVNVSQSAISQIAKGGGISAETAVEIMKLGGEDAAAFLQEALVGKRETFPNLEVCLAFEVPKNPKRWSKATVAAARAGAWPDEVFPHEWAERLDALEKSIRTATRGDGRKGPVAS